MKRVMKPVGIATFWVMFGLAGAVSFAAPPEKNSGSAPAPKIRKNNVSPLPAGEKAVATHAPFEVGDCSVCHTNADPKNPGPLNASGNAVCFACHDDLQAVVARKYGHVAARESCINCHNPHNAKQPKLLVEEAGALCLGCHEKIKNIVQSSVVKHDALTTGKQCANCHNPHGANVEHLLIQLPMNLCLSCHGKDDVADHNGKKLVNIKTLLAENPVHHGPVAAEDCSACHNPHGYKNFRLLNEEYPAAFYSPFDPKLYALCFECHDPRLVQEPESTTLTGFRNGAKNLHFIHVNKAERGRTCRACHDVHASKQEHQLREGVPYGAKGWILKLNYTKTPAGGSCAKTCHEERRYDRSAPGIAKKE